KCARCQHFGHHALVFDEDDVVRLLRSTVGREGGQSAFAPLAIQPPDPMPTPTRRSCRSPRPTAPFGDLRAAVSLESHRLTYQCFTRRSSQRSLYCKKAHTANAVGVRVKRQMDRFIPKAIMRLRVDG